MWGRFCEQFAAPATIALANMFSLFYGLWKLLTRKSEFHILILGIDHAGKTVRRRIAHSQRRASLSQCVCGACDIFIICVVGRACWSE